MFRRLHLISHHINKFSMQKPPANDMTIFDKIISKQIKSSKIYAFDDINPQAPVHVLIIPKIKDGLTGISKAQQKNQQILGYLLMKVNQIAKIKGIDQTGYRIVINEGAHGQQTVPHLHLHLIGGKQLKWPPG